MTTSALAADAPGHIAGRPLDEWNSAYARVEAYFHALRVENKVLVGQLVLQVLERAMRRSPSEPNRTATELAAEEMDLVVTEWFATVLERIPTGVEQVLSARGRLALLLADMPGKWQDQFLRPGPWPEEFVNAMRETYVRAGPDFQWSEMTPRPLDLGPMATLTKYTQMPATRVIFVWGGFALLLVIVFILTHR